MLKKIVFEICQFIWENNGIHNHFGWSSPNMATLMGYSENICKAGTQPQEDASTEQLYDLWLKLHKLRKNVFVFNGKSIHSNFRFATHKKK